MKVFYVKNGGYYVLNKICEECGEGYYQVIAPSIRINFKPLCESGRLMPILVENTITVDCMNRNCNAHKVIEGYTDHQLIPVDDFEDIIKTFTPE